LVWIAVLTVLLNERLNGQWILRELMEASMKDITTAILAIFFVLLSLVSLISADPMPMSNAWAPVYSAGSISELELRYALRR
jgi:hypothetical protein